MRSAVVKKLAPIRCILFGYKVFAGMAAIIFTLTLASCYTFKGFSISDDTRTYDMIPFSISRRADLAPPDLGETFSETLKEKVRQETPLSFVPGDGDVSFRGEIVDYAISSVGPRGSDDELQLDVGSDLSRLTIVVKVDYTNTKDESLSFAQNFSFFADFNNDVNLSDVQESLQEEIFERILEDIFNAAFSNW